MIDPTWWRRFGVDAYSSYIMNLTEARLGELRREAAEHAMSRAARQGRPSVWARARGRLARPTAPAVDPVVLPVVEDERLRRSA
jgi:hypothetical protein